MRPSSSALHGWLLLVTLTTIAGAATGTLGCTPSAGSNGAGGVTNSGGTAGVTTIGGQPPDAMNVPPVQPPDSPDHPLCPMLTREAADIHPPYRPFAESSIWNRPIPAATEYADIHDALFGDPDKRQLGIYIVDNATDNGHTVAIATEDETARFDLAGSIDPATYVFKVDLSRFDGEGFSADVIAMLHLIKVVTSNAP